MLKGSAGMARMSASMFAHQKEKRSMDYGFAPLKFSATLARLTEVTDDGKQDIAALHRGT